MQSRFAGQKREHTKPGRGAAIEETLIDGIEGHANVAMADGCHYALQVETHRQSRASKVNRLPGLPLRCGASADSI